MDAIASYPWIPPKWRSATAWAVPLVECSLAAGLWVEPLRRFAAIGAIGLLSLFTILMVRLVLGGGEVGCGCFGSSAHRTTWFSVARNVVLIISAAVVVATSTVEASPPALLTGAGVAVLILLVDLAASALVTTKRV
ncbi:MAG: hypothetical protein QOG54_2535 [Actinomycetota bacterium]|nr:hypothetical protein [Actinomycetota bacterium]